MYKLVSEGGMTRPIFLVWSEALLTVWQLAPFWLQMLQIQKRALAGGVGGALPSPQTVRNATDLNRKPTEGGQTFVAIRPSPAPPRHLESCAVPVRNTEMIVLPVLDEFTRPQLPLVHLVTFRPEISVSACLTSVHRSFYRHMDPGQAGSTSVES